ncbi:MAG: transglutaminase domain-containing protein [Solobacterium sp.]|nr:transglutaminase domain-containing protein [Solobacterium sp.]
MLEKMKYLGIALPEIIRKYKDIGDLSKADSIIDMMLDDDKVPEEMKERLILEKEILRRYPENYPYTEEEGLQMIRQEIPDFTMEELQQWEDRRAAEFVYINGEKRLYKRFFGTMKKVYPDLAKRAGIDKDFYANPLLDENIACMKKNGHAVWHFRLRHQLRIKDEAFRPGEKITVHLPVPTDAVNMKNIRIISTEPEGYASDLHSGQRTVCFSGAFQENRPFAVEYEYDSETVYNCPEKGFDDGNFREFTREEAPQIVFTPVIRLIGDRLRGTETDPVVLARRVYDFVTTKMVYSFVRQYLLLGIIPEYAIGEMKGDCGVQALTFITLCRYLGIPARWQSGQFVEPSDIGNHDWAMFYAAPYGWMFADCSFGGAAYRAGNTERHNYYFGNLDPFRMASCSEFMCEFDPPKKHYRIDPYDNQSGEAEYEDRGLDGSEFETERTVIDCKKTA